MSASLTFLLGAGFSAPFGIPTMRPFLHAFHDMAKKRYPDLASTLERHFAALGDESDIEGLLSSLGKAERLTEAAPPGASVPDEFLLWEDQSRYLKSHLIAFIIEQCERFDRDLVARTLTPSLKALYENEKFTSIHMFTTNYDRIVEYACEVSSLGFSDGFGKASKELVAPWERKFEGKLRLYKLHGSVSYYVDQTTKALPVYLRLDRGYPLPGPGFRLSREGNQLEPLMVVPTLEKDALGEPYSYLNHMFSDTMADTTLVVAVGISLRDNHIVSAINYNADKVIVLLVDIDPITPGLHMPGVRNAKLSTDSRTFFESSIFRLISSIEPYMGREDGQELFDVVEQFGREEGARISEAGTLGVDQQAAFRSILSSSTVSELLEAVGTLRGINVDRVVQAIADKGKSEYPTEIRKAVAGCLGFSTNPTATSCLSNMAKEDVASEVRLEAYLALSAIDTEDARAALQDAKTCWPTDSFFSETSFET